MALPKITPLHVGLSGYLAGVCRQLRIAEMVNRMVTWDETHCKRSPGTLVVALIINMLMGRRPLYRVWESFEHLDLPVLFDEPVELGDLNDDAFGRTLDRLHASDNLKLLIHSIALRAVNELPLGIVSVHADTTSISLCGTYDWTKSDLAFAEENPEHPLLKITHGYSKDHRPDLKQFIYGLIVSGEGLPLMADVRDGNTNDKMWNRDTLDEIQSSFLDPQKTIYVADSALVTGENLAKMAKYKMRFVSRLPETYKLAAKLKEKAWSSGVWDPIGPLSLDGKGAVYKAQSFIDTLEGRTYRFIVVHSTALDKRKMKSIEKRIAKENTELQKAAKELAKKRFSCHEDAEKALAFFLKEHQRSSHPLNGSVQEELILKRPPGRPAKDFVPEEIIEWRVTIEVAPPSQKQIQQLHDRASTFVLITNLNEGDWPNADVLREYKGQTSVENRFRNLKAAPCIVDNVYVKSSRRAEALAYLFLLALIVASFIEIRIRQELKKRKAQFMMPGKRLTDRPTMTGLFDILETVLVVIVHDDDGVYRVLPENTDPRVQEILDLTGFDDTVYTQVRRET